SCFWLGRSEVVTSFESSCPQFFFRETPPNEALEPENPAWICQRYQNQYYYATLYDRNRRIPVYSAYLYQPASGTRPNTWLVEPQVSAILQDYKNLTGYNRGHLNPSGQHCDSSSRTATFTLTNIVPQNEKLNGGAWNNYEQQTMMRRSQGCNTTYVIVGAVPGNNYIAKGRVNIPSYLWSSACCEVDTHRRKTWAVIAENDKNEVQLLTLGELEDILTQLYGREQVSLFSSDCPRE
ncbi:ENDD1 protein, partial [Columbina picui]|nr:ENDD1 protein [Columbina picui]